MRAPVRGKRSDKNQQDNNNNRPSPNSYYQDNDSSNPYNNNNNNPGVTTVKAPLLTTKQQQYDTNALSTEEEYQRQRLHDIEDVQQASAEVQALFRDFKTMTDAQQEGLNTVEQNIDTLKSPTLMSC